jgi:hypothetical protein
VLITPPSLSYFKDSDNCLSHHIASRQGGPISWSTMQLL